MIKLSGSRFTQIMPENLAGQVETQAFAYAVGRKIEKLCAYSDAARTYAAISTMPEWLLDYMAVELRTPSYDENYSLNTKRTLIQGSLLFYSQMGTPAAVNRIIETIFQTGYIEEWYEYNGDPHHFRAYVGDGGEVGPGALDEFRRILASVKRLSSWLDEIITIATMDSEILIFTCAMGKGYTSTPISEFPVDYHLDTIIYPGGTFGSIVQSTIPEARIGYCLEVDVHGGGIFGNIIQTAMPAAK